MSTVRSFAEYTRLMPQAPEVEEAVLGALLMEPDSWTRTADILTEEAFYSEALRAIYSAGRQIWSKGELPDQIVILQHLRAEGKLDVEGKGTSAVAGLNPLLIAKLTTNIASARNIEWHCRILTQHLVLRKLIEKGDAMVKAAYANDDALELLDRSAADIRGIYRYTQPTHLISAAEDLEELTDVKPRIEYTFGIPDLDRICTLEAGLPHVFAGRPGMGKSIFCLEVCWHLTLTGKVLLFGPEMTPKQVRARLMAHETGIPYSLLLKPYRMNEQQRLKAARAAQDTAFVERMDRLKIDPTGGITPEQIRTRTELALQTEGIVAFAVDHLHKMRTGNSRTDQNPVDRVTQCMAGITEVAKNTMLPALVMCQLNRNVESRGSDGSDKRPRLSDLRGSGAIEEDAAVVGLLYRDGYYRDEPPYEDDLEIGIAKNRDGAVGDVKVKIIPAINRIGTHAFPTINEYQEHDENDRYKPF